MTTTANRPEPSSPTLVATIADKLRQEILSGGFLPGTALREIPLSEHFGTSRQSVREALRALADEGLVELQSRRGALVPKLSPRRTREIYTLRALIEPFALRSAMIEGRIKSAERAAIQAAYQHMVDVADCGNPYQLIEADMAFHWSLCSPSDHHMLLDYLDRLQSATRVSIMHMKVYGSETESDVESHAPILRAVMASDADSAARALHAHITQNGEQLLLGIHGLTSGSI